MEYNTGCNTTGDEDGSRGNGHIYYYWIAKYFDEELYQHGGTCWLCAKELFPEEPDSAAKPDPLSDEEAAGLIQKGLLVKDGPGYRLNFACFTEERFAEFVSLFQIEDEELENALSEWIVSVRNSFSKFVSKRLHAQINQWVSMVLFQIVGHVTEELMRRGVLKKPMSDWPLTNGVFYVSGKYINP